jgi:hypothetical protein
MNYEHQITLNRDHQGLKCARFMALGAGALALVSVLPEPLAFFAGVVALDRAGRALSHAYFAHQNNQLKKELLAISVNDSKDSQTQEKLLQLSSTMNENSTIGQIQQSIKEFRAIQTKNPKNKLKA